MAKFKNGTTHHSNGRYPRMSIGPHRYRYVHVLVAEGMLGRKLHKNETVHHKDGDIANPAWSNLIVIDVTVHNAVSRRQYWYLKQKYSREDAAWRAYFDVTGETYGGSMEMPSMQETSGETGFGDTSFVPELLIGPSMDEADSGA